MQPKSDETKQESEQPKAEEVPEPVVKGKKKPAAKKKVAAAPKKKPAPKKKSTKKKGAEDPPEPEAEAEASKDKPADNDVDMDTSVAKDAKKIDVPKTDVLKDSDISKDQLPELDEASAKATADAVANSLSLQAVALGRMDPLDEMTLTISSLMDFPEPERKTSEDKTVNFKVGDHVVATGTKREGQKGIVTEEQDEDGVMRVDFDGANAYITESFLKVAERTSDDDSAGDVKGQSVVSEPERQAEPAPETIKDPKESKENLGEVSLNRKRPAKGKEPTKKRQKVEKEKSSVTLPLAVPTPEPTPAVPIDPVEPAPQSTPTKASEPREASPSTLGMQRRLRKRKAPVKYCR